MVMDAEVFLPLTEYCIHRFLCTQSIGDWLEIFREQAKTGHADHGQTLRALALASCQVVRI